jgi:flagellar biosynthesis GTPase FlhF
LEKIEVEREALMKIRKELGKKMNVLYTQREKLHKEITEIDEDITKMQNVLFLYFYIIYPLILIHFFNTILN